MQVLIGEEYHLRKTQGDLIAAAEAEAKAPIANLSSALTLPTPHLKIA